MNTDRPALGILLILAAMGFLSVMDATVKKLLEDGMAVLQMLAVRSWMIVPVMGAWAVYRYGIPSLKTGQVKLHLLRVFLGTGAPLFYFNAVKTLPLADANTIFFGATFIMTALSVPVLKEHVGPHRWGAILVGFVGVVIAMRPGSIDFGEGALYAFLASVAYALFMITTRKLGAEEGAFKQVLYFHIWLGMVGSASLPFVYRPFSPDELLVITVIAVLVVAGHLCMTRAFALAPVGLLAPFEYSSLLWATGLGIVMFGDYPGSSTLIGAGLIVSSGIYLIYRESRTGGLRRSPVPSPAPSVLEYGASRRETQDQS